MKKEHLLKVSLVVGIFCLLGIFYISHVMLCSKDSTDGSILTIKVEPINNMNISFFDGYRVAGFDNTHRALGVTSADFNNDGNMDFAVSYAVKGKGQRISIFLNDGNLSFTKKDVYVFSYSEIDDLDSGDYDNDGDVDLMFTHNEHEWHDGICYNMNGTIKLLFNDGNNCFTKEKIIARRGTGIIGDDEARINPQLSSADYDMDGDIDLLVGDNSGKVEFYLNDGRGNFTAQGVIHDFGRGSWGLASADFDNDGDIDFIVDAENEETPGYGHYYLKRNNVSSGCFASGYGEIVGNLSTGTASLAPIDYDGDGDMDFVTGNIGCFYLFINGNTTYKSKYLGELPRNTGGIDVLVSGVLSSADFNNDGKEDFISGGSQGIVRLFISNIT
ncbi:MAG: VCBS repeat-containing protein [Candidatus Thermoplasmatota archaeon]|nr:VCBS repeat-containing protein [Candidatus Thermoplasmatota archaeon]